VNGRLAGKVALITGAAGGIGGAIAARFRAEGATVVAADRAGADIDCDISDRAQVDALVAKVLRRHARLDVLAHTAALTGGTGRFLDVQTADWHRYIAVNLDGSFHVCQAAARAMAGCGGGAIVAVGSVNSCAAEPEAAAYVASKHGVLGLVRAMAVDLARAGIRVNMIAPGPITVPRNAAPFGSTVHRATFARVIPMGAPGQPDQIAHAAVYLASHEADYVTGSVLTVDGGMLAQLLEQA
jgi:NAD(P)-dependent dehydrogenase (short-subunit alcohol dehydrogenase family)